MHLVHYMLHSLRAFVKREIIDIKNHQSFGSYSTKIVEFAYPHRYMRKSAGTLAVFFRAKCEEIHSNM